jgi:hypothetical protein
MTYNSLVFDNTLKEGDVNADFLKLIDKIINQVVTNVYAKMTKSTDSTTVSLTGFYTNRGLTSEYTLSDEQESKFENLLNSNNLVFSENNHQKQGNPSYTIRYNRTATTPTPTTSSNTPTDLQTAIATGDVNSVERFLRNKVTSGELDVTKLPNNLKEEVQRIKQLIK